jgi:amino acid adenylation domain-containing protein
MTWSAAETNQSIAERFESQARAYADKTAIGGTSWQPTFAELGATANWHAHALLERCGVGPGRVALLLRHDAPLFAAALGVLKAGKTVVALNAGDPPARLERIRRHTDAELVVTDPAHRDLALRAGFAPAEVLIVPEQPGSSPEAAPELVAHPDDVAFLIYTSGSTGRPKGVIQTHRNALHNVLRHTSAAGLSSDDRVALLASMSGGQGIGIVWSTLLNGATLCPFPTMERGITGLAAWLEAHRVTVLVASASVFRSFVRTLREPVDGIRLVRLASEAAFDADFDAYRRHFSNGCLLLNTFSSSETGNIARSLLAKDAQIPAGPLPVGRAAEGIEVFVLDERGAEVPPGEVGEIVVRSAYLSPGYWRNEALTAERFVADGDARLFHTGDVGRLSEDGVLTLTGRKDLQVKVHGSQVVLPEIEAALASRREVTAAAVQASSSARGDVKLTAYVSAPAGATITASHLRKGLRAALPAHAVPTSFVFLDSLPLTPHGKVDREQLAQIEPESPSPSGSEEPLNETEELLGAIWTDALELDRVGRGEDFFALGGDSLAAAVIAAGVYSALGVELDLCAVAGSPTVGEMARLVDRLRSSAPAEASSALPKAPQGEPLPASFAQERVWRSSWTPEGALSHNMATALRISGWLDATAFRRSVEHIFRRHEVLRTTFEDRGGRLVQVVHPPGRVELPCIDLSRAIDPDEQADELLDQEARRPFDLERGPLIRLLLVRIRADEHRLLRVNHHIISDGWSWRVFFDELRVLYEAYRSGDRPPLPDELPRQYGDFAVWQCRFLDPAGPRYRKELAWWKQIFEQAHAPIAMPFARDEPGHGEEPSDGVVWWGLRPESARALDRLGREAGATYFMTRLAVFAAELALETGREDIVVGTYVTNRRLAELQVLFGDFSNLATLRLRLDGEASFRQWLARVRAVVLETSANVEIPYERLCRELRSESIAPPEIRAVFGRSHQLPPMCFGGLELAPVPSRLQLTPTGFTLLVDRSYEADRCHAYFDPTSYDSGRVRGFIGRYQRLAAAVGAQPDLPLQSFSFDSVEEPV